jgi:hypothetical protein
MSGCAAGLKAALFLLVTPVFADFNGNTVPDSSEIRRNLVESWFMAPLDMLRERNAEVRSSSSGTRFQIRLEEQDMTFRIFVSPETKLDVDVYSDTGVHTVKTQVYPGDISGSWMLERDKQTGKPVFIRYYFAADSDIYVQFSPSKDRTFADMIIYNNYAARSLPLGIPYEKFYTASFKDIYSWTKPNLPWQYTVVNKGMYHSTLQMIQVIRDNLPEIIYADDAMYDETGRPVSISTGDIRIIEEKDVEKLSLSSAGFVKWVVDGLIIPLTGNYTKRAPLLVPTVEYKDTGFPGTLGSLYDLSFSLDWTRNLAAASLSIRDNRTYLYKDSGVDVTLEPFSSELTAKGISNTVGYVRNTGYAVSGLKSLLYVLTATEPGYCYLAAIRQTNMGSPEVRPFNQCAVLFPYQDSAGHFCCTVFENSMELTLQNFIARYKNDFVHLVRVQTSDRFFPQHIK